MAESQLKDTLPGDWADADRAYNNSLELPAQGIEPMSWIDAQALMREWSAALAARPKDAIH